MAKKENDATYILDSKKGLPNKLLQADGTTTDMLGNVVVNPDEAWDSKPALPNKWLNPDGTYSTLNEIIASMVDTGIYVIVDELPAEGDPQKIYLVSDGKGGFVEYHWTGTKWDPIGMVEFDISKYSTTQEMMNAIEAAGILTLNSAKTYTDEQIAGISVDPQVFYWDGKTDQNGINFWNNVRDINKESPVVVFYIEKQSNRRDLMYSAYIAPNSIINNYKALFDPTYPKQDATYPCFTLVFRYYTATFTIVNDEITSVNMGTASLEGHFLDTISTGATGNIYVPTRDNHPANKKYVDDCIATSITDVLNTSY